MPVAAVLLYVTCVCVLPVGWELTEPYWKLSSFWEHTWSQVPRGVEEGGAHRTWAWSEPGAFTGYGLQWCSLPHIRQTSLAFHSCQWGLPSAEPMHCQRAMTSREPELWPPLRKELEASSWEVFSKEGTWFSSPRYVLVSSSSGQQCQWGQALQPGSAMEQLCSTDGLTDVLHLHRGRHPAHCSLLSQLYCLNFGRTTPFSKNPTKLMFFKQ